MAYDFSSLLSMAQAHFVSEAAQPQQKDEQLTVFWENIPPQLLREAREWLVENRLSVADFTVEHKQYEGTWHLVSLQAGEQVKTGRVQAVFQKGYATSLTWALARLTNAKLAHTNASTAGVADSSSDNPIRYLNVRFPNIDRSAVNSIISGISTTYTDVELSSETYSGEWHVVYATSGLQQEGQKDNDGAAFIEIFLAKPQYTLQTKRNSGTPQERTVWYCWDVPQAIAQSVIDTFEGTGTSVTANNNSAQNLVDLILESSTPESGQRFSLSSVACSQRVYDYVYRSVSNPDAYALPSTSTDGVIYSREESLNDDGTYNVLIKATLSRNRIFEFESFSAPFSSESTISYRANPGLIQAPQSGSGGVYRLRQDVNPDCTYDADLTYKAGLNAGEALFGSERGGLSNEDRAVYRDRTFQVTAPQPGQRGIYQADNQLTEEGLYNSSIQYRTSKPASLAFSSQNTKFKRQSDFIYRNSVSPISAPVPSGGGVYRVDQQINPDLTYDARLIYTAGTADGKVTFSSATSALSGEVESVYRDASTPVEASAYSVGVIRRASNQITEDGLYNSVVQTITSNPASVSFLSRKTAIRTETTTLSRNSSLPVIDTPAAGNAVQASVTINQDGTYDSQVTEISETGGTGSGFECRADRETTTVVNTNASSEEDVECQDNCITRVDNQPNDFGGYRTVVETICAKNQTSTSQSRRADQSSDTVLNTHSSNVATASHTAGTIQIAQNTPTEFGTFRTTLETITANQQTAEISEVRGNSSMSGTNYSNASNIPTPSGGQGAIIRVTRRPNEFGRFDGTTEVIIPVGSSGGGSSVGGLVTSSTTLSENTTDSSTGGGAGGVNSIVRTNVTPTEFPGRYRKTVETITAASATGTISGTRGDGVISGATYVNATAVPATSPGANAIVRSSFTPNEYGSLNGSVEIITPTQRNGGGGSNGAVQSSVVTITDNTTDGSTSPPAGSVNTIGRLEVSPGEFPGTFRRRQETVTATPATGTISGTRGDGTISGTTFINQTSMPADPGNTTDAIIRRSSSVNEFGSLNGSIEVVTPTTRTGGGVTSGALQTSTIDIQEDSSDSSTSASAGTGEVVRLEVTPSEFPNRFRRRKETITASEGSATAAGARHGESISSTSFINSSSVPSDTAGDGETLQISARLNEFGYYDGTYEKRTASAIISSFGTATGSSTSEVTLTENSSTSSDIPAASQGVIVRTDISPTEFKSRFRHRTETITATNQVSNSWSSGPMTSFTETENTSSNSEEQAPVSGTTGEIVSYNSQPTEFGTYKTSKRTTKAVEKEYSFTYSTEWHNAAIKIGRNRPSGSCAAAASQNPGATQSVSLDINEFGLEDYRISIVENRNGDAFDSAGGKSVSWESTDAKGKTWSISKGWFKTASAAESFIGSGAASSGGGHVTGIGYAGRGRYIATKVVEVSS